MSAVCNVCHAPKGMQAIGESCNNNCGGKVVESSRNIKSKVPREPVPLITIERREEVGVVYEGSGGVSPLAAAFDIAVDYVTEHAHGDENCNLEWEYGLHKFSVTVEPKAHA